MAHPPIIRRTEKLKRLIRLLKDRKCVYISSFFYSGKSVLLDQLQTAWDGTVLRFNSARDDWAAFTARARESGDALLLIDSIDDSSPGIEEGIGALLAHFAETQSAVLVGRAQLPASIHSLYSLMVAGLKNAKIASVLNITERTVKYFCGLIYKKLCVTTRAEALNRAAELGDMK